MVLGEPGASGWVPGAKPLLCTSLWLDKHLRGSWEPSVLLISITKVLSLKQRSGCSGGCSDPGLSSGELNFTFLCGTAPHAPLPCWLLTACGGGKQREAVPAKGHSPPFHIQAFRVEFFSFWSSLILNPGIASPRCPWAVLGEEKLFCPSRADQGLPPLLLLSILGQKSREGTSSTSRPGDVAAPSAPGASPS